MNINIQFGETCENISFANFSIAFVGDPIDDRGRSSYTYVINNISQVININYLPNELEIGIDGKYIPIDSFSENIPDLKEANVLIDATTIGFVELLLLCQLLIDINNLNFSILYVEPASYNKKQRKQLLHYREFDLSVETHGYEAIPGHALTIDNNLNQKVVFLCGYEEQRMNRAMDDLEISNINCKCIFGLPAFKPGWEMDSFANNIRVMKSNNMNRDIDFCGATNPTAVFDRLNVSYRTLEDDDQMFVVPLATKPMSIGACLFLATKPKDRVAVLYDHPKRLIGRGIGVGKWHLYSIAP